MWELFSECGDCHRRYSHEISDGSYPLNAENAARYHPDTSDMGNTKQKVWSRPSKAETATRDNQERCRAGVGSPLNAEAAARYHPETSDTEDIEPNEWSYPANAETAAQNTQDLSDRSCPLKGENAAGYHPASADTVHIKQKVWSCPDCRPKHPRMVRQGAPPKARGFSKRTQRVGVWILGSGDERF